MIYQLPLERHAYSLVIAVILIIVWLLRAVFKLS